MSHRSFRSTLVTVASGLAAVVAVSWSVGTVPALAAADYGVAGIGIQAQEWWLAGLHVTQAWQTTEGTGITVAVLGTGVAAGHPDLAGRCRRDRTSPGRAGRRAGPLLGHRRDGSRGVIAGHGHGTGGEAGILGVAPAARILSVRVVLDSTDPLNSEPAAVRRLPAAIAEGIRYAAAHGAQVIDLPLDPAKSARRAGRPGRGRRQYRGAGGGGLRAAEGRGPGRPAGR